MFSLMFVSLKNLYKKLKDSHKKIVNNQKNYLGPALNAASPDKYKRAVKCTAN